MLRVFMKRGDLLPSLSVECTYSSGTPVDLSAATAPKFYMRLASDSTATPKINATAAVDDGPGGVLRYSWSGTDTDTAGTYIAEFEVQIAGRRVTFPGSDQILTVVITPDIA